ncbi:MAG: cobalamin biosynthesis protein [archaeon]|nr:cobalamin biosynthesis protein [archaeon]MCP8316844.1 cobalamin biosynthesis protein [archaeon]MCP8319320.1 cobalamin biosynthesis protein [archaeon]
MLQNLPFITESMLILILALILDLIFGEPPEKLHPTVWMGKTIEFLKPRFKGSSPKIEKIKGIILGLTVIIIFALIVYIMLSLLREYLILTIYIIFASALLKTTFSINCMDKLSRPIGKAIKEGKMEDAKSMLRRIVRRDPTKFDDQKIISATVECVAESTVDGITSPLFYYSILGLPLAIAYRAINTLDSTVGYKDEEHVNIGWFSAKMDSLANYIPARITATLMVLSAWLLHEDWRRSWEILKRDRKNTESPNAGWTMSAMAGAFNAQLEKPGFYILGDSINPLNPDHIPRAIRIMKLTTFLFVMIIVLPIIVMMGVVLP